MKRKLITALLSFTMLATALAACGNGAEEGTDSSGGNPAAQDESKADGQEEDVQNSEAADDLSQHRSITAWLYADDYKYYSNAAEKPVVKYLNEMFNCDIEFQQPPMGSEMEGFSTMLGTGEYTDVMEITYCQESTSVLFEDGVIRDLAPYVETYMPNYYAYINDPANEDVKRALYDDEGHLFLVTSDARDEQGHVWGGMAYRRDILETMTGGNIAFPSGNGEPVTVEDWEYMLELMTQYFQAAGFTDYAGLILPYQGYFSTGEILNGFGAAGEFYAKDGKVGYGLTEEPFYNYLVKMREWYEKGWIYQDFASRTNDLFYLPNAALTYGGSAGIFFAGNWMLGTVMSMPEYNLEIQLEPMAAPLDTEHGIKGTEMRQMGLVRDLSRDTTGWVISTSCSEENMIRFMTWSDYLFSEEGKYVTTFGLTGEDAANDEVYQSLGLEKGTYWLDENGTVVRDERISTGEIDGGMLNGMRLPGYWLQSETMRLDAVYNPYYEIGGKAWGKYGYDDNYPTGAIGNAEESSKLADFYTYYNDYANMMIPKFIMGTEELTPESFQAFVNQMNEYGVEEAVQIMQDIYDRYMAE